jgi:hypothetical protein
MHGREGFGRVTTKSLHPQDIGSLIIEVQGLQHQEGPFDEYERPTWHCCGVPTILCPPPTRYHPHLHKASSHHTAC